MAKAHDTGVCVCVWVGAFAAEMSSLQHLLTVGRRYTCRMLVYVEQPLFLICTSCVSICISDIVCE